jgi:hypothetical protein
MLRKNATRLQTIDDLYISSRTGLVSGATTWSETRVSGGGGGGYIHNGSGHMSSSSISSTVTERQRFFLVQPDGEEREYTDTGLAVRDGQTVTVIIAGHKADGLGWPTVYYNHQTRSQVQDPDHINWLTGKNKGSVFIRLVAAVIAGVVAQFVMGALIAVLLGPESVLGLLSWLAFVAAAWWAWKKMTPSLGKVPEADLKAVLDAELERAKALIKDARDRVAAAG